MIRSIQLHNLITEAHQRLQEPDAPEKIWIIGLTDDTFRAVENTMNEFTSRTRLTVCVVYPARVMFYSPAWRNIFLGRFQHEKAPFEID